VRVGKECSRAADLGVFIHTHRSVELLGVGSHKKIGNELCPRCGVCAVQGSAKRRIGVEALRNERVLVLIVFLVVETVSHDDMSCDEGGPHKALPLNLPLFPFYPFYS